MRLRPTYFLLFLVLFFALFTRLIWINQIPANVNPDEADTIRTYIAKMNRPLWPDIIATNWNGAPAINMYLIGWGWHLSGESLGAIKITAIILSSLSLVIFYFAVWRLTKSSWLAFGFSLLLASDPLLMHFSRSGWENILVAVPVTMTLYIFSRSPVDRQDRWRRAVALILIGILSLYLYHPGKILFAVNLLFGAIELIRFWWSRRNWPSSWRLLTFMCMAFLLTLPFFYSFFGPYRTATLGRINNVSVFSYGNVTQTLMQNTRRVLVGFTLFGGKDFAVGLNDRYSDTTQDLLLPVLTILYLVGFGLSIKYRPILTLWFLLLLLPVQVFSTNSPDLARAIHLWPVIYWFMTLTIWRLGLLIKRRRNLSSGLKFLGLIVTFVLVYSQLTHYFTWMSSRRALKSREPAIWDFEYQDWVSAMKTSVKSEGVTYGVYEWKAKTGQPMP